MRRSILLLPFIVAFCAPALGGTASDLKQAWSRTLRNIPPPEVAGVVGHDGLFHAAVRTDWDSYLIDFLENGEQIGASSIPDQGVGFLTMVGEDPVFGGAPRDVDQIWVAWPWPRTIRRYDVTGRPQVMAGAATPDGGVVIAGAIDSAAMALKLARNGDVEWMKRFDVSGTDDLLDTIQPHPAGGYVAGGYISCGSLG